jgi:hypothetical protein
MADEQLIRSMDGMPSDDKMPLKSFLVIIAGVIVVGGLLGFMVSRVGGGSTSSGGKTSGKVDKIAGVQDKKTFKDKAEGILKEGGIDGEGSYHLQRPGGESQNVYLTSSTVDLSVYIDKKVRVWGETFSGEKAGWLMDVGLVEVL